VGGYGPPHWTGVPESTIFPAALGYDGDGGVDFTLYGFGLWLFNNADVGDYKGIWTGGVPGNQAVSRRALP